jgi:membrane protein DedA with SNARE-associated domain
MAPDCRVGDTETFAQRERLGEVARGHLHLVAVLTQALDHRPHHEHVRAVRQINPNAHLKRDGIVAQRMLVLASITESLVNDTSHFVRDAGLPGIFALMAIGSACIPIPSEVVMLFAGFAVADPNQSASHHHLTILGIVLAGLLGTMVGSWVTYAIGRGGRLELLERHGSKMKWNPLHPAQISRAERWFERFGEPVVFFGRMVPLLRAFVSLPAGVARMPFWRFTVLSLLGSIPWVLALALAGHALGGNWTSVRKDFQYVDYAILALIVAGIVYAVVRRRRGSAASVDSEAGQADGGGAGTDSNAAADAG